MAPRPLHQLCGQCDVEQCGGELYRSLGRLHTRTRLSSVPKTNRDSSLNTTFCQSVAFHIDLAWHHCRRSCRCSDVKGSARKGHLDLRFASARCLKMVCGTIATPTSTRIVERVTVGSTRACRTILRSSLLVVFLVTPDPVFRAWVPSHVHCSQKSLTEHSKRSTWPATRRVDERAVFILMIRNLSNSINCEKCFLACLPVDVCLNERTVSSSNNTYPYRAIIETFLNHGYDSKTSQLTSELYYKDTAGRMNVYDENDKEPNEGFKSRVKFIKGSGTVDMVGRLHVDLFNQDRLLLNLVDVKLKLIRNKPSFCLMGEEDYNVIFEHVSLYISKILSKEAPRDFLGVYPSDKIPKVKKKAALVVNTDPHDEEGSHWLAMYIQDEKTIEFFDSYGFPPSVYEPHI
ncbi:uncharacterized protein TNCV_3354211 [Trichonephila clavipes]|nr:uncharacterized protein TNCV_3354211 [Trichonephila clavipes]